MATNDAVNLCSVCGDPVEPHTETLCGSCGNTFHLNQRTDRPGKDCGDVWINSEHLGLEFTCQNCLDGARQHASAGTALDDIVDLPEAAALLGIGESELRARADSGEIPHRQTAGGLLLFERSTLVALQGGTLQ